MLTFTAVCPAGVEKNGLFLLELLCNWVTVGMRSQKCTTEEEIHKKLFFPMSLTFKIVFLCYFCYIDLLLLMYHIKKLHKVKAGHVFPSRWGYEKLRQSIFLWLPSKSGSQQQQVDSTVQAVAIACSTSFFVLLLVLCFLCSLCAKYWYPYSHTPLWYPYSFNPQGAS